MNHFILVRVDVPEQVRLGLMQMIIQMGTIPQSNSWTQHEHPGLNRVQLIKFLREQMNCGLKEAKDYVDELIDHLRRGLDYKPL